MNANDGSGEGETQRTAYYAKSALWADLALGGLKRSEIEAWALASAAISIASLLAVAIFLSPPSSRPVLYAVGVDGETGLGLQAEALASGDLQLDRRLTDWNLVRYVVAREGFHPTTMRRDFDVVARLSSPTIATQYASFLGRSSPTSPLNVDGPSAIIDVQIQSVSLLTSDTALVRYSTVQQNRPQLPGDALMAVVTFSYSRGPMRDIDRWDNPLGFQVIKYNTQPV